MKPFMFKFFQKLKVVGEGKRVGVVCLNKEEFHNFFRDLFFKESMIYKNVIYQRDAKYYPIFSRQHVRGNRYHHIIESNGAIFNYDYENIMNEIVPCIINDEV